MGRQKGEGGRSKVRPSSSSVAASLLPSSSTATVGFGGYVGSSRLDSSVFSEEPIPYVDIDSEIAVHLKRLARKDPTTKLKALTSLSMVLKKKSGKDIVPIVPQWAFEYKKLLLDYNRDVRRATHDIMTDLVIAVGRDLAPHLKTLMGPWWFSQFDPVSEVSQAAKQSLQAAFPAQEKRLDALILCTTEIFMYLEENLKLTPETISDKAAALDELEEIYHQVISSSLLALATLLDVLISMQLERPGFENITAEPKHASKARVTAISFAGKLFTDHKYFQQFLKSQSRAIRSATYIAFKSFIKNIPEAFNDGNINMLAEAIFGILQEKDPTCHSSMWDLILLFSKRFPVSWNSVNVHKTILNPLWHLLKNGCFGSQQVSYPSLVLFLNYVPPKAIVREKFFLEFFKNLWAGRNPSHSSNADRLPFFMAYEECFLWVLRNASRYYDGVDSVYHFRVMLVDEILVKLSWKDYLMFGSTKGQDGILTGISADSSEQSICLNKKAVDTLNMKHPMSYLQELGKCIIKILSGICLLDHDILSSFSVDFQEKCLGILQNSENRERSRESIERIILFLLLLEQLVVQKSETWPLVDIVGPTLAKSFPIIKSLDSPDSLRLLSVAFSVFGPLKLVRELFLQDKENPRPHIFNDRDRELEGEHYMQIFRETFVPWCLNSNNCSSSARLDLLLAMLDDEYFSEQWDTVVKYATNQKYSGSPPGFLDADSAALLALLLEKARDEITKRKRGEESFYLHGAIADHWHHEGIESAAIAVVRSSPPFGTSDAQFLCAALGGSTEGSSTSFVSRNALILIYEEALRKLLFFIKGSSFSWVKIAASLLEADANQIIGPELDSSVQMFEMAHFALEILDGSFFCLRKLVKESALVSGISAAIFIVDWEYSMAVVDYPLGDGSRNNIKARLEFGETLHAFRCKIGNQFWRSLSLDIRMILASILIQSIRYAIFSTEKLARDKIASLGYLWVLEVLESLSLSGYEEQDLIDQLLRKGETWPVFVIPDSDSQKVSDNLQFISLIDRLISKIGIDKVVAACTISSTFVPEPINQEFTSRAWLAAEILCTWKWEGGSAVDSFLPSLSAYAKSSTSQKSLLDKILSILIDGALVHGGNGANSSINVWPVSARAADIIEEPFLRALVSFLSTVLQDNIWDTQKAVDLFELLVDKLFIGEAVNTGCLKILPVLVNVLLQSLCRRSIGYMESSLDSQPGSLDETIKGWLEKCLLFPPIVTWQTVEDLEDWFQLVFSCYPFSALGGVQALKPERNISPDERRLLFQLFRKQRQVACASAVTNQLPVVQMLLSKLSVVSVGYCWNEFTEEDWDFLLSNVRGWIQSVAVMMEDVAEDANESMVGCSPDKLDAIISKIEKIALVTDPLPINTAENALLSFSLFLEPFNHKQAKNEDSVNMLRTEILDSTKDRILEGILRLFFCTGISEAIANSYCKEAASVIASSRLEYRYFWELVASCVVNSSAQARDRAVKSVEFWGLSKGAISSLYAILFSSKPIPLLQYAAYVVLSTDPVSKIAILEDNACNQGLYTASDEELSHRELSIEDKVFLKEEISSMIEKSPYELLEMDLLAQQRVNIFLAWSLLISYLWSLPSSSPVRERLVQYIQDSASVIILDCLFQHIPVESSVVHGLKKKEGELPTVVSEAANGATRAVTTGSLLNLVESLWPIEPVKISTLAGAVYGLMLRVLPAYVRGWFSDLRDRNMSSSIESFTKTCCSPPLIAFELSQIKKTKFTDENFSVSVSKSANEIVATYTKDETGMDLVIRLPASYPLRAVDVDCTRSLGISEVKQRKWLMSMMLFVRNQNGALAEAIGIWKHNFDKEFEGVEECPICYSVIHTTNHSLPRLACKTCKHKFHSACLYKWFSTSHKSSCPLCQSPF
ncbi:E3 ubiquitin-protein ligase listerin [Quillaja saponaria]|uniref:E3 ubiquitin-protein ligase listerin n=1 Tax=Quillaja saponaria TaxID=32244 RepID=A0AAD7QJL0_QUISA|nr:E3 ubiquitin-protein ligase listerin [Quillaja saponaria]